MTQHRGWLLNYRCGSLRKKIQSGGRVAIWGKTFVGWWTDMNREKSTQKFPLNKKPCEYRRSHSKLGPDKLHRSVYRLHVRVWIRKISLSLTLKQYKGMCTEFAYGCEYKNLSNKNDPNKVLWRRTIVREFWNVLTFQKIGNLQLQPDISI